jgi:hypothetical protein
MSRDRREFMKLAGATVAGAAWAAAQTQFKAIKALAFDAYGTLFDVFSVTALCEQLYPGRGNQLAHHRYFLSMYLIRLPRPDENSLLP